MVRWTLYDTLAFLLLLSLLLPSLLIMFIPSTFKRPVSSWKALNLRKTLLMASSVRLKPLNCSRLPFVYAQETLTFLLTQKKFFFSSRRRHTRSLCDWSSECALPISGVLRRGRVARSVFSGGARGRHALPARGLGRPAAGHGRRGADALDVPAARSASRRRRSRGARARVRPLDAEKRRGA